MALPHADDGLSEHLEQGSHAQDPLLQPNETQGHEAVEATPPTSHPKNLRCYELLEVVFPAKKRARDWIAHLLTSFMLVAFLVLYPSVAHLVDARDRHHTPKLPISTNPNITYLQPEFFKHLHSERVQIKYGPFETLPSTIDNGMLTFEARNATPPCRDCFITFIQAGLEYPDGSYANADTGMWLHHVVIYNIHPRPGDTVCPWYIPERFFASGNERTPVDFTSHGKKEIGYYIPENVTLLVAPELMNDTPYPRPVIVTITYEYVRLQHARELKKVTPVWLDVSGICGPSDVNVPVDPSTNMSLSAFNLTMTPPWTTNITGTIAFSAGHIHDGGISLSITRNGTSVCDSIPTYGASPGYMENNSSMVMNSTMNMGWSQDLIHISNMSTCDPATLPPMKTGEEWGVEAQYDFMQHAPMLDMDGTPSPVMGIALVYVVEEEEEEDCDDNDKGKGKGDV